MHPEVDNEEDNTIRLYKSMPYKMYGIMPGPDPAILKRGGCTHNTSQDIEWMLFGMQYSKKSQTWNSIIQNFIGGGNGNTACGV